MKKRLLLRNTLLLLIFSFCSTSMLRAQITVSSNFEGGNGIATSTNPATNEVSISSELKGGDTKNIVYYVKISGLNPAMPLKLKVDAFWRANNILYSYDNVTWQRTSLTGQDNFQVPLTSSIIYIAHSYPYTYSNMLADVNAISGKAGVNVANLTTSEGGRPVKLVRITDECVPDAGKELIWIIGRLHAFENPGNLCAMGMLNYFASDEASAKRLRKEAIIYVVPMMDVDMAFNGGSGKDQTPVDFNRDWKSLTFTSHWNAVRAAKQWMDSTAQLNNFSVFMDSHSPPPSQNTNLFYYMYEVNHHLSNIRFVTETVKQFGNYSGNELLYSSLSPAESQDYVISNYDNPKHYNVTMETGFNKRPDGVVWTKEMYILNGEYHGRAISDYINGFARSNDKLVDNKDAAHVVFSGSWTSDTAKYGYFGDDYKRSSTSTASVTFSTTIDSTGTYEVFTRWVSDASFATNAPATFSHSGNNSNFNIDMTNRGGNWVLLDTFQLSAGEQVSLKISNSNTNKTIIADGLRISKVKKCPSLGILGQNETQSFYSIYPNPAKSQFTIQLKKDAKLEMVNIYNTLGTLVLSSKESLVNTSTLANGIYTVEVKTNKGKSATKLVIQP